MFYLGRQQMWARVYFTASQGGSNVQITPLRALGLHRGPVWEGTAALLPTCSSDSKSWPGHRPSSFISQENIRIIHKGVQVSLFGVQEAAHSSRVYSARTAHRARGSGSPCICCGNGHLASTPPSRGAFPATPSRSQPPSSISLKYFLSYLILLFLTQSVLFIGTSLAPRTVPGTLIKNICAINKPNVTTRAATRWGMYTSVGTG